MIDWGASNSLVTGGRLLDYFRCAICRKTWSARSIVWLALSSRRQWSPRSLVTGLGGSEQSVIYLSKEWAKSGYLVTVYTRCAGEEGVYDGVQYLDADKFNRLDTFETLIIWRNDNIPYLDHRLKAKRIWLDLHDVVFLPYFTNDRLKKIEKICVKSDYHKSLLPDFTVSKACVMPNGIDKVWFQYSLDKKNPYKLIYASGYDRGLEYMLRFGWPIIKLEIPQAELHIYAPWGNCNFMRLLDQPGVTHHGRVGVTELMKQKAISSIHYYACTSAEETDCISVRESAAVGCVPVTTDYVALSEKPYCIKVPGPPCARETQEAVARKIVELLKDQTKLERVRQNFLLLVKDEAWDRIASLWLSSDVLI